MKSPLLSDVKAATALEFALLAPVFVAFIMGIAQLGLVFSANAGLNNALAEGARHATLFPRPTAQDVRTRINAGRFGLDPAGLTVPAVDYNVTASPNFAEIRMSYTTRLNFILFQTPVTLTQTRKVYLQPLPQSGPLIAL